MKKMLCIADKVGRIQYNRMVMFQKMMDIDMDVITIGTQFDESKYDLVYYTSYKIFKRFPCKGKTIASITSHKGLRKKTCHYQI